MWKCIDRTGERYGRLLVCDCGAKTVVTSHCLQAKSTRSCGCLSREISARNGRNTRTHGQAGKPGQYGTATAEYMTWARMKNRCYNDKDPAFKWWGARGITVCDEWRDSFEAFYRDMGPKPLGLTLERKDNSLGYSKDNCMWATQAQQQQNRRDTVMSLELAREARRVRADGGNVSAWARSMGINEGTAASAAAGKTWKDDGQAAPL